jgi:hypothetical protein
MKSNNNPPRWLERAKDHIKYGHLEYFTMDMLHVNVADILKDSCFYLSAGADITPIVAFKDLIYSYILCDQYLYDSIEGISDRFLGILVKLKDRLIQQGFLEIQKFNLDKHFLGIKDRRFSNGYISKLENCEISFWSREDKIYSVIYINHDNTYTYKDLYIGNDIMPKAICELLPEGGSLKSNEEYQAGGPTLTVEQKKNVLPEYVLGHTYSIGDARKYEIISGDVEYFGDYLYSCGKNGEHIKARKGEVHFLQILKLSDSKINC